MSIGAYYYFFRYPPSGEYVPEDTLIALDEYYTANNLPIRYYQLDVGTARTDVNLL
jgi:hypothetical protein